MSTRSMQLQRYERRGLLAIDPRAFFEFFMPLREQRENEQVGDVAVVEVQGPLYQHDEGWCDSYEAITRRVAEACQSAAKTIVLRIDSPGGDAAGCFDTARTLRAQCAAAGKPLLAYVEGKACSAAYALACAADQISVSNSALVGSIGVISTRDDFSAANAARGVRVAFVTSGSRKADGNPDLPITEAELKETQVLVDSMAAVFFDLVAEMRGIDAQTVAGLDAKLFHGTAAISAGLADNLSSFDELLASIATGEIAMKSKAEDKSPYETARAALEEAAKGDDANAAAAKRALAAMEPPEPDEDDKPEEAPKDDKAATDPPEPDEDDKPKDDKPKDNKAAAEGAEAIALHALAEVHTLRAEKVAERTAEERKTLLASRPDFAPELLAALETAPMRTVREMVTTLPKGKIAKLAATAAVTGTRGVSQGGPELAAAGSIEARNMDERMGLSATKLGVRRDGNAMTFGAQLAPAQPDAAQGAGK
jgi:ClpP class serine protease